MQNKDTIIKIVESISELGLKKIFIFGSRANGVSEASSDYDICVILNNEKDKNTFLDQAYSKMWDLKIPVDLIVYYEDEFNAQINLINTIPNEVLTTSLQIYAA